MEKIWKGKPDLGYHKQRQRESYKSNVPHNHCYNAEFWKTQDAEWEIKDYAA